ncbi:hypothetical protein ACBY01_02920 [Sphingomonas sp. ac-8]|uniref:hypothetical protein n=1 Tax=Sphingomonas sp. ac-8 TaxID=3242977 RepID=UPI003A803374
MMARLRGRGEAAGARAVRDAVARIADAAEAAAADLSGIAVERDATSVTISARGLWQRRIDDARVRWLGAER